MASEEICGELNRAYKELEGHISNERWNDAFAAVAYLNGYVIALNNCGHIQFSEAGALALVFRDLLLSVSKEKKGKSIDTNMDKLSKRLEKNFRVKF
ncbi:MAG: hypothetical protein QF775_01115 [archaeon]|jgi:hypothetical protein|nr:hypothetical protein [Euryarchaeota archaeon]MDP6704067.1 hypothetical protein [archaeon]HIK01438.1 hypothetical protein [Candidatus Undinarchaeales archaeon ERR594346 U_76725]|tara:strand:+ start:1252 stop:1542 length:291 start_codon:yes stop_codon:yes gene_type:complete